MGHKTYFRPTREGQISRSIPRTKWEKKGKYELLDSSPDLLLSKFFKILNFKILNSITEVKERWRLKV